jgi:hypothetical protein
VQRQGPEEEELLQGKFATVQRDGAEEEELLHNEIKGTLPFNQPPTRSQ